MYFFTMKKTLLLLLFFLCNSYSILAQNCETPPPSDNRVYPWCYWGKAGTNWDTTPYKPYIINGLPFRLLFPKDFDSTATSTKKYPLLVILHGVGQVGTDNNYQLKYGAKDHLNALNNGRFDGFIMIPQSPVVRWGTKEKEAVMKFVEAALRDLPVDPFRVLLEGYSGGATAAWRLAHDYPQVFAAAIVMSSADAVIATWAETLKYTSIWHAQGGRDTQPSPTAGDNVANSFTSVGANYKYQYYPEQGHGTWFSMYKERDFFPFLMRSSQLRIHVLHFKQNFCNEEPASGTMGVTPGFDSYEWRKDGQLIAGANANELNFNGEGLYSVRIKRKGVWSVWSEPVQIQRIPPSNGTPPTITAGGPTALPTLDGRTTVTLYAPEGYDRYYWSDNSTADSLVVSKPGSYSVAVAEEYGCASAFSAPVKVTFNAAGVLPEPENLIVTTVSESSLNLSWTDKSTNERGFEVYRSTTPNGPWVLAAQLNANTNSFADTGLNAYTRYYYAVRSVNTEGGSHYLHGNGKTGEDLAAPGVPANLAVTQTGPTGIGLQWQPVGNNGNGQEAVTYEIYAGDRTTLIATTTQTTYKVNNLAQGEHFSFVVRAVDAAGNRSGWSNQVTAGTFINGLYYTYYEGEVTTAHDIPLLPVIKTGHSSNFDILGPRNRNDLYAFKFEGYLNILTAGEYTFFTVSDDGSILSINGTEVVNNDGEQAGQEQSGTITLEAGIHEIKVLYYEALDAEKLEVYWQGPGITKALIPDEAFTEEYTAPTPPEAPADLSATAEQQSIQLAWTDRSTNEHGFEIYRSTNNDGPFTLVATIAENEAQYTDAGLQPGTTYYYKLRAIGATGESEFTGLDSSNTWVNAKTAGEAGTPAMPANLLAIRQNASTVLLQWTDNAQNETAYEVWRGTNGTDFTKIGQTAANLSLYSDNTADAATGSYYYRVRAMSAGGASEWSNVAVIDNQNQPPVIAGIPAVISAPYGETTEILFDLSDPDGDALTLKTINLPDFATVEVASESKGKIILAPTAADKGFYEAIQLTASDGAYETDTTFSISIKELGKTSVYINMGNAAVAGRPWNNTNSAGTAGDTELISDLIDEEGNPTGYSLTLLDPWSTSQSYGETSGNDTGIYPDVVTSSAYIINPDATARFKISGLQADMRYNFVFFGSSIYKSHNGSTNYTIGSETVSLAVQSNINKTVQINGVKADANGEVVVTVAGGSDATKGGYLNAMVIEQYADNSPMLRPGNFDAYAVSKTQIDLSWTDNTFQESGFEIWRRTLPSGSFALVNTTAANITNYADSGLNPNTGYEYKIRAVAGGGSSEFTEVEQAATLLYQVLINANYAKNADDPWNNLDRRPTTGDKWYNFRNEELSHTGINMNLEEGFDGDGEFEIETTGAIYPDNVIKTFYFSEIGVVTRVHIYGLDDDLTYNFRFFASSNFEGGENGVSEYRIGSKKVTLDVQDNLKNTAVIRDVKSENGSIFLEVEAGDYARYGYLNALVIEARDQNKEIVGATEPNGTGDGGPGEEIVLNQITTVYPNPTQYELTVEFLAKKAGRCYLQVMDVTGKTILLEEVMAKEGTNTWSLNLRNPSISKGMYILRVKSMDFDSKVIRFMKQ